MGAGQRARSIAPQILTVAEAALPSRPSPAMGGCAALAVGCAAGALVEADPPRCLAAVDALERELRSKQRSEWDGFAAAWALGAAMHPLGGVEGAPAPPESLLRRVVSTLVATALAAFVSGPPPAVDLFAPGAKWPAFAATSAVHANALACGALLGLRQCLGAMSGPTLTHAAANTTRLLVDAAAASFKVRSYLPWRVRRPVTAPWPRAEPRLGG